MTGREWREDEKAKALQLFDDGKLTHAEIGMAIGRSRSSVNAMIHRVRSERMDARQPIAKCDIAERLARNAVEGSSKLLAEIRRVFGS